MQGERLSSIHWPWKWALYNLGGNFVNKSVSFIQQLKIYINAIIFILINDYEKWEASLAHFPWALLFELHF